MSFMDILRQYAQPDAANAATSPAHFDKVLETAPPQAIGHGVAEAFRSEQTPPFGDMVAQLFGQSNNEQRAGVLTQLLGAIPPGVLSGLAGGAVARMVSAASSPEATNVITPAQASQLTPAQVQEIAAHAQKQDPGIVDRVGSFYSEHPQLVKSLGGMALAVILGKMASR